MRVLVVDDNEDAASMLGDALRDEGLDVAVAYSGPEALDEVERFAPDAAVLDLGMPVMDGFELATRLRATFPRLRLVALSGYVDPSSRRRAQESGFDAHLAKPSTVDAVLRAVTAGARAA
jgi:CheY-like chemotaxis protein